MKTAIIIRTNTGALYMMRPGDLVHVRGVKGPSGPGPTMWRVAVAPRSGTVVYISTAFKTRVPADMVLEGIFDALSRANDDSPMVLIDVRALEGK